MAVKKETQTLNNHLLIQKKDRMKLRIAMLLVVFLSVFSSFTASAGDGCKDNCCSKYTACGWGHHHHRGCWGHHGYYYGPDGCYAKHKDACCNDKKESCCDKKAHNCCATHCDHTYSRVRYHEDCCGRAHLHVVKDNDNDD